MGKSNGNKDGPKKKGYWVKHPDTGQFVSKKDALKMVGALAGTASAPSAAASAGASDLDAARASLLDVSEDAYKKMVATVGDEVGMDGYEVMKPFLDWYAHMSYPSMSSPPAVDWKVYAEDLAAALEQNTDQKRKAYELLYGSKAKKQSPASPSASGPVDLSATPDKDLFTELNKRLKK